MTPTQSISEQTAERTNTTNARTRLKGSAQEWSKSLVRTIYSRSFVSGPPSCKETDEKSAISSEENLLETIYLSRWKTSTDWYKKCNVTLIVGKKLKGRKTGKTASV